MNKKSKLLLSAGILLLTLGVLIYYISKHRNLLTKLAHIPVHIILLVLVLYIAWLASLVLILQAILFICRKPVSLKDNLLLNAYSLFANFFIPGQTGPALRGVYLKRKWGVRYRDYIYGMLLYYFFYGVLSVGLLLGGSRAWWQALIVVIAAGGAGMLCFKFLAKKLKASDEMFLGGFQGSLYMMAVTLLQSVIQVVIYYAEIHAVTGHIAVHQVITYTGAAQLALFVGLTPGAIGIRETFLIFTEKLHHISSVVIVEANVIDRGVFLVFLGLVFLFILSQHANKKLQVSLQQSAPDLEKD